MHLQYGRFKLLGNSWPRPAGGILQGNQPLISLVLFKAIYHDLLSDQDRVCHHRDLQEEGDQGGVTQPHLGQLSCSAFAHVATVLHLLHLSHTVLSLSKDLAIGLIYLCCQINPSAALGQLLCCDVVSKPASHNFFLGLVSFVWLYKGLYALNDGQHHSSR